MTNLTPRGPIGDGSSRPRGAAARERLLDAALESFATRGFHGTGTRDIAQGAGMSPAAVYVHHRSKEDLLFTLTEAAHRDVLAVVLAVDDPRGTPAGRLRAVVREYTVWHARRHTHARVAQYEMAALSAEHRTEIVDIRRAVDERVRRIIEEGVEQGFFTVDSPRLATVAVLSLGIDVARWYRDDGTWTPDEIGEHYGRLALGMVRSIDSSTRQDTAS